MIEQQISELEAQLSKYRMERFVCELMVEDAKVSTGNTGADEALKVQSEKAANTIVMLDRQIQTREAALLKLKS